MTYVSSLYHVLNKKRNQDLNAHRVGKTINQTIDLSSKIQQYEASIQALLKWIRDKTNYFKNSINRLPPSTKELSQLINQFTQYRRGEKAQKSEEGARLEEILFKIDLLTKELRARPYMPTKADLQLTTLEKAWEALGQSEHAYELALRDAYNRGIRDHIRTQIDSAMISKDSI
ncbi:unnamed protein product [Dibothriocephalus latus]|uniref:Uncharacterized protein n=1 Tax=Dibothriocephalus latus TaxID=60516 RepID=A0A3P7LME5_DIBLA|nr:unnamed protein product [Dibothriocephalus latus]